MNTTTVTFAALLAMFFGLTNRAVTFEPLSIQSLSRQANVVLQGTVLSKTTQRDPSGRIYTQVELRVAEVWKGAISNNPFRVVHGGGILGEEQAIVSGQVEYRVGEDVVVFLVRNQRGEGVTLGLMQGKFHVWRDGVSGVRFVSNPFHGLPEELARFGRMQSAAAGHSARAPLSLGELKERVLEAQR